MEMELSTPKTWSISLFRFQGSGQVELEKRPLYMSACPCAKGQYRFERPTGPWISLGKVPINASARAFGAGTSS